MTPDESGAEVSECSEQHSEIHCYECHDCGVQVDWVELGQCPNCGSENIEAIEAVTDGGQEVGGGQRTRSNVYHDFGYDWGDLNRNSLLSWLPAIEPLANSPQVNLPTTTTHPLDIRRAIEWIEGEATFPVNHDDLELSLTPHWRQGTGDKLFVRTDISSAKHYGPKAFKWEPEDGDLKRVVRETVEDNAIKMGMATPQALVFREWIDIDARFRAFDGTKIGVEFRFFASPDGHICHHYYWPEDSIRRESTMDGGDIVDTVWRAQRDKMATVEPPDYLADAAVTAARKANEAAEFEDMAYSVDFARDEDGDWWLIDMAVAAESWHPDCEDQSEIRDESEVLEMVVSDDE